MPFASSGQLYPKKLRKKAKPEKRITVGEYLLQALSSASVHTLFGTSEKELKRLIEIIEAQRFIETNQASTMASGFAKIASPGCFFTTQTLLEKEAHHILRASYEHTPLIAIVGTKNETLYDETLQESLLYVHETEELENIFHKLLRSFFIATFILDDRATAAKKIDRAIDIACHYQKPVAIEISEKMVDSVIPKHLRRPTHFFQSDPESLRDGLRSIIKGINTSESQAIVIGSLVGRIDAADFLIQFAEHANIPIYTLLSGRGVIDEMHPLFRGPFHPKLIEQTELVLFFGPEAKEVPYEKPHIYALQEELLLNNERIAHLNLYDLLHQLSHAKFSKRKELLPPPSLSFQLRPNAFFKKERAIQIVDHFFAPHFMVAMHHLPKKTAISEGSYLYSSLQPIPLAIGALFANSERRALILCNEEEFEENIAALKIAVQYRLSPIVILFAEEEAMVLPIFPYRKVSSEQEFFTALTEAFSSPSFSLIVVQEK